MTNKEALLEHLTENWLFASQAEQVMQLYLAQTDEYTLGRWLPAQTTDYPPSMLALSIMALNRIALNWIDANIPQFWARAMFDSQGA